MCGIVGYIGGKEAKDVLLGGLKKLEYRGYDSAGICLTNGDFELYKSKGKIVNLEKIVKESKKTVGIGHTRWATHGEPSDLNAHPHVDCKEKIALVHNGIIENYEIIKKFLLKKGHKFKSETDTEVLVHLIEHYYKGDLETAVKSALQRVVGTYGICVVAKDEPGKIVAARKGSPLILGLGDNEYYFASDASAILGYTKKVVYFEDEEVVVATRDGFKVTDIGSERSKDKEVTEIEWSLDEIEKSGFDHFMIKEIFEQPEVIAKAFSGRIDKERVVFGGLNLEPEDFRELERIVIVACGTSWHAALIGKYAIERLARIPVEVEYASEFRYKKPILNENTLAIVISQSGETADTLAGLKEAKAKGAKTLGIVNVVGSTIAREVDGGIYTHAGPEIGVASTKAFTTQVTVLILLAIYLGRVQDLSAIEAEKYLKEIMAVPDKVKNILDKADEIKKIALKYKDYSHCLYLGRDIDFPIALEGALKLKEISYIHAEGFPTAEMKHGPIALIDETCPSIFIVLKDDLYEKSLSNLKEIKARKGKVLAIATEGDTEIEKIVDDVIFIPKSDSLVAGLLAVIPLQLIAYYIAVSRGCDVDQPRNLAKSVTVE